MGWNPHLQQSPQIEVICFGDSNLPRFEAERFRQGLNFTLPVDSSTQPGSIQLYLLPLVRINKDGLMDCKRSQIFLFNGQQVDDLQNLLA